MSTQALTADAAVADGTTYVSSATAGVLKASLSSDYDEGDVVLFESTADSARILICDSKEAVLGFVQPQRAMVARLTADSTWDVQPVPVDPAANVAAAATTAATNSTPYGYSTSAQADAVRAVANAALAACVAAGLIKAE